MGKLKEAYDEAMGISEEKCMNIMVRLFLSEQKIHDYVSACGLKDDDFMGIFRRTLRGQQVGHELYKGMLKGLEQGVQQLHRQDAELQFKTKPSDL